MNLTSNKMISLTSNPMHEYPIRVLIRGRLLYQNIMLSKTDLVRIYLWKKLKSNTFSDENKKEKKSEFK